MKLVQEPGLDWHLALDKIKLRIPQFIDKFSKKIISIPSDIALSFTSNSLIEDLALAPLYQQVISLHCPQTPNLSAHDLKIIKDLKAIGVSVTSLEMLEVSNTQSFLNAAQELSAEIKCSLSNPKCQGKHTLTINSKQLLQYPEVFYWGVNDRFLNIAERYLNLPVAYDGLSYYYSVADGKEEGPRKWHRDKEDWRMIKMCVYLNSVDGGGGSFECVFPSENDFLVKTVPPYQVLLHNQVQKLFRENIKPWYQSYLGAVGTVIFVDTARFYHRGAPPTSQDRAAIFFSYFSDRPKNPFFCGRSPLSQQELYQLAQSLPDHQRKSVLWKDELSGIGHLIPKNRVTV